MLQQKIPKSLAQSFSSIFFAHLLSLLSQSLEHVVWSHVWEHFLFVFVYVFCIILLKNVHFVCVLKNGSQTFCAFESRVLFAVANVI